MTTPGRGSCARHPIAVKNIQAATPQRADAQKIMKNSSRIAPDGAGLRAERRLGGEHDRLQREGLPKMPPYNQRMTAGPKLVADRAEHGTETRHVPQTLEPRQPAQGLNAARSHASLEGHTPLTFASGHIVARAELNNVRWVSHCRDLVQLPVAA